MIMILYLYAIYSFWNHTTCVRLPCPLAIMNVKLGEYSSSKPTPNSHHRPQGTKGPQQKHLLPSHYANRSSCSSTVRIRPFQCWRFNQSPKSLQSLEGFLEHFAEGFLGGILESSLNQGPAVFGFGETFWKTFQMDFWETFQTLIE